MTTRRLSLLIASIPLLVACRSSHALGRPASATDATSQSASAAETLATVNGVPITRAEVHGAIREPSTHGGTGVAETEAATLERLIQEELQAQRAVSMGLDHDPAFQAELDRAQASLNEWRRSQLATLLNQQQQTVRATVSDAEARAYYDANAARIRTEVHIAQILLRDEAAVTRALADVRAGAAFEEVARRQFPGLPPSAGRPWDLGFLRWNMVPEAWRDVVYTMPVGQTSDVIRGPNNRFWIINVVDRQERAELTFEAMRPAVTQILQDQRTLAQRTSQSDDLRRHALIVYSTHRAQ